MSNRFQITKKKKNNKISKQLRIAPSYLEEVIEQLGRQFRRAAFLGLFHCAIDEGSNALQMRQHCATRLTRKLIDDKIQTLEVRKGRNGLKL